MYNLLWKYINRKCPMMVMTVYVVVVIQDFADNTKQQNICSNIKGQNIVLLFDNKYPNNGLFVMVIFFL